MASNALRPLVPSRTTQWALHAQGRSQLMTFLLPFTTTRHASNSSSQKSSKAKELLGKKKKPRTSFTRDNLKNAIQFSLCDAMRYIRAFEVGQQPASAKYELHVSLKTTKNGPAVRNRLQLPYAVNTSQRVCVICPPNSPAATAALNAGASIVGEDVVFSAVQAGEIDFEKCICHVDSQTRLAKANLGRLLGPKGLMPSVKAGTVVKDVGAAVREMIGGSEYRERMGVVRLGIGQLGFTPEQVQQNIKAFMAALKKDLASLSDRINKEVHEVVLSSTHGPGLTLSGDFKTDQSPSTQELSAS